MIEPNNNRTAVDKAVLDFLTVAIGSKDVSLAIAKDPGELNRLAEAMEQGGFERSNNVGDLVKLKKTYYLADSNLDKKIYDFVVQYPTGQVEIFDDYLAAPQVFVPDHASSAVILLVNAADLPVLREKGFNLTAVAGAAFQF